MLGALVGSIAQNQKRHAEIDKMKKMKYLVLPFIAVVLWVLLGAFFYWGIQNCTSQDIDYSPCPDQAPSGTCGWTFGQSYYYSIQAGLSIGFGLLAEDKSWSRLYTVFHIIAGSSCIAGALALFASVSLERSSGLQTAQEKRLAKFSAEMHENGYKGLNADQMVELCLKYPTYLRDVYMKLYTGPEGRKEVVKLMQRFEEVGSRRKKLQVMEAMTLAHEKLDEFKDGRMSIDELRALHQQQRSPCRRLRNWIIHHKNSVITYTAFGTWVLLGIIYGMAQEGWDFIQSLYFAISTLSTAGLQAVTPCGHGFNVVFAGTYAIIGIPIFGMTLGTFANLLVDQYNTAMMEEKTKKHITMAEVEFIQHLNDQEHREDVDLMEYMEINLLRLGKVDRSDLTTIRDKFKKLDENNSGRVRKEDFLKYNDKEHRENKAHISGLIWENHGKEDATSL